MASGSCAGGSALVTNASVLCSQSSCASKNLQGNPKNAVFCARFSMGIGRNNRSVDWQCSSPSFRKDNRTSCSVMQGTKTTITVEGEEDKFNVEPPDYTLDRSNVILSKRNIKYVDSSELSNEFEHSWVKEDVETACEEQVIPEVEVRKPVAASKVWQPWDAALRGIGNLTSDLRGAVQKSATGVKKWAQNKKALKILENDKQWIMNTALPVISEALLLMSFEDPSAVRPQQEAWKTPSYPGLSGWDLVAADIATIRHYFDHVKLQLAIWTLPLQDTYEPQELANYFNARPHVLLFRALEVSAAFSYLMVWYMFEKSMKSLMKGRQLSEEENLQLTVKTATMFKEAVLKLGPTFTKVAQSLSTRSDLIGPEPAKVLADLQDRNPPFSNEEAMITVERELGRPINEIFMYLSKEPIAAASLGQVYRGRTKEGQEVAVKVQRPGILYSIARDVYLLRLGLGLVRKIAGINSDLSVFADEIGRGLYGELDYRLEAENASAFRMALTPKLPFIVVPKALPHLTTKRVMTMEWIAGTRPVDLRRVAKGQDYSCSPEQQQQAKTRLLEMVNKGVQSSLTQLLDAGILHADPHPGNIIYTPENSIGYLDFGLICRMEKKHQYAMIAATAHLVNGDWNYLVEDMAEMDVVKPNTNRFRLRLALEDSLSDFVVKNGLPDFKFSQVVARLFKVALKFRFRLPPYYTLILRSIASLEGMALAVDPNFKVLTKTYPFVIRRLISDNSLAMRRILRTLLLTSKREFRWDRIASFLRITTLESKKNVGSEQSMESTLCRLILSRNGASLRRIVLEADTQSLAKAFISKEAAPARLKLAKVLTDAFYMHGKELLQRHGHLRVDGSSLNLEYSSPSILNSRHLQFLVGVLFKRLREYPLLMFKVCLSSVTVLSWSLACALHRLAISVSDAYLVPSVECTPAV